MSYEILLSDNGDLITKIISEVKGISIEGESYRIFDDRGKTLFIAPQDSVIYISMR